MHQKHLQNLSHVSGDVNLVVENLTEDKNRTTSANRSLTQPTCQDYACKCDKDCEIGEYCKGWIHEVLLML